VRLFNPPCSISEVTDTQCAQFDSQEPTLNEWLSKRARHNEKIGASRTFDVTTKTGEIAGYFCLSTAAIAHGEAS